MLQINVGFRTYVKASHALGIAKRQKQVSLTHTYLWLRSVRDRPSMKPTNEQILFMGLLDLMTMTADYYAEIADISFGIVNNCKLYVVLFVVYILAYVM